MLDTGARFSMPAAECRYAYRQSIFKQELRGRVAITYVTFRLSREFRPQIGYGGIRQAMAEQGLDEHTLTPEALRSIIIGIRRSKLPDPDVQGNAGSFS
jgi:UDP-N-acetylmuramate dehydrogenase